MSHQPLITAIHWPTLLTQAQQQLAPYLVKTPLVFSSELSTKYGRPIFLKLETLQPTHSFKVRPAFNSILSHLPACQEQGVLTTSSGNFAQATAFVAQRLGLHATIVMTDDTSAIKIEKTRALGAEIVFCGTSFESRFEMVEKLRKKTGAFVIHPFDSIETIAGDGTIALELLEQIRTEILLNHSDPCKVKPITILCPASGGGLAAGISVGLPLSGTGTFRLFVTQPLNGGALTLSLRAGLPVTTPKVHSIADALVAITPGLKPFEILKNFGSQGILLTEDQILAATRTLNQDLNLAAEPGGATSIAALENLCETDSKIMADGPVICILSGGNLSQAL